MENYSEISLEFISRNDTLVFFPGAHDKKYGVVKFQGGACLGYNIDFPNPDIEKYITLTLTRDGYLYTFYVTGPDFDEEYKINPHETLLILSENQRVSWGDISRHFRVTRLMNVNLKLSRAFSSPAEIIRQIHHKGIADVFVPELNTTLYKQSLYCHRDIPEERLLEGVLFSLGRRGSRDFISEGFIPGVVVEDLKCICYDHLTDWLPGEIYQSLLFNEFKSDLLVVFQRRLALLGFPFFAEKRLIIIPLGKLHSYIPGDYTKGFENLFNISPADEYTTVTYLGDREKYVIGNSHVILANGIRGAPNFTFQVTKSGFKLITLDEEVLKKEAWLIKNFIPQGRG